MNEEEINLKENWQTLQNFLKNNLGKKPTDLNGVLLQKNKNKI
jgi:ABC-type phosphate/phosphonate transport system substrate-binding protein